MLLNLYKEGLNNHEIARSMKRTQASIGYHLHKLNLKTNGSIPQKIKILGNFAICSKCKRKKLLKEFYFIRRGEKYPSRLSYCKECKKQQVYNRENLTIDIFLNRRFVSLKARAKRQGILFEINKQYYKDIYYQQKGKCFYTGIKMKMQNRGESFNDSYSMSLDRKDNSKGYIKGNVVMCLRKVNFIKSDLTLNELKLWIPKWYKKIKIVY